MGYNETVIGREGFDGSSGKEVARGGKLISLLGCGVYPIP